MVNGHAPAPHYTKRVTCRAVPRPTDDEAVRAAMDRLATPDPTLPENTTAEDVLRRALPGTSDYQRGALEVGVPTMLLYQAGRGTHMQGLLALAFAMGVRLGREIEP